MWLLCQLLHRHQPSNPRHQLARTVSASSLFLFVCCCFAIAATQCWRTARRTLWYVCASHKHARNPRLCNGRSWFLLRSSSHVLQRDIKPPLFLRLLERDVPPQRKKTARGTEKLQLSHRLLITCSSSYFFRPFSFNFCLMVGKIGSVFQA